MEGVLIMGGAPRGVYSPWKVYSSWGVHHGGCTYHGGCTHHGVLARVWSDVLEGPLDVLVHGELTGEGA